MPCGPAKHQDLNHILGASLHGIVHSGAQRPQVPPGVNIFQEAINICMAGAKVAPPRVLAMGVEAQRSDAQYRSIWIVHSAFIAQTE